MGIYFEADVVTKASLGSCHTFSLTAEFPNLPLGFGSTTAHQDSQSQQLGVGGGEKRLKNRLIQSFFCTKWSFHREIALFGLCPPVCLPVLAL